MTLLGFQREKFNTAKASGTHMQLAPRLETPIQNNDPSGTLKAPMAMITAVAPNDCFAE